MDRQCSSCGGFCKKSGCERAALAQHETDTYGYAKRLAEQLSDKHYKQSSPEWRPLDTTLGVLTQIDNMTCRLVKEQREWVGLTDEERSDIYRSYGSIGGAVAFIEAKLKEKNT